MTKIRNKFPYKGSYADLGEHVGVMCTWYEKRTEDPDTYHMCDNLSTEYCHLDCYLCTLTSGCISMNSEINTTAICGFRPSIIGLHKQFRLTNECVQHISRLQDTKLSVNAESTTTNKVPYTWIILRE